VKQSELLSKYYRMNQDYVFLLPVKLSVFTDGPDEASEDSSSSCDVDVIVTSVVVKLPAQE